MTPLTRPIPLAVLVVAAALPAAFTLDPALDHDTWWHLAVGRWIENHGTVPETDPFSRLGHHQPTVWIAYSWLYELGLYQVFEVFGPTGVLWLRTLLGAVATAAVFAFLLNRPTVRWADLLAVLLGAVTLMPLMKERPWHLTIVFTVLTLATVAGLRDGGPVKRSLWLPAVFALWANLHIQFVLGWLVLGLACLFPGRANRRHLVLLTAGCVLATAANPYHVRLFGVVWDYATQTGPLRTVQELAPPDFATPWPWAALALLGGAAVVAGRRRPVDWFAVVLLAAALVLTLRMRRDVWFGTVAAFAVLRLPPSPDRIQGAWVGGLVCLVFVGCRLLAFTGLAPPADDTRVFPGRAVEVVRERNLPDPLFNPFDWGGYLIWALPDYPVSIDGRTNLYGSDRVTRSMATWAGEPGWEADPDLATARLVIAPTGRPLTERLRQSPDWRVEFEDGTAVVFVRR